MEESYKYPKEVNADNQFTPELMALWDKALLDLKERRNQTLRHHWPKIAGFCVLVLLFWGKIAIFLIGIAAAILGFLGLSMRPNYDYTVSSDRKSASFHLNHIYRLEYFLEVPLAVLHNAKKGLGEFLASIFGIITMPIWFPALAVIKSFEYINNTLWLHWFEKWTVTLRHISQDSNDGRSHVRGTNLLPSVQLSGTAPTEAAPPPIQQEPLEVLDGLLTLFPDGGIALAGGVAFDRHSTFSNFSMNGLTLTRESEAQLKVSHEGSNRSFGFDGSSWEEI